MHPWPCRVPGRGWRQNNFATTISEVQRTNSQIYFMPANMTAPHPKPPTPHPSQRKPKKTQPTGPCRPPIRAPHTPKVAPSTAEAEVASQPCSALMPRATPTTARSTSTDSAQAPGARVGRVGAHGHGVCFTCCFLGPVQKDRKQRACRQNFASFCQSSGKGMCLIGRL